MTPGVVFIGWLTFQSLYRINALCPYCILVLEVPDSHPSALGYLSDVLDVLALGDEQGDVGRQVPMSDR